MKYFFAILAISIATPILAQDPSEQALIRAEVKDAEARQRAELDERLHDLERQQEASRAIAEKQQQLIEALQAQIRAMQEKDRERPDQQE